MSKQLTKTKVRSLLILGLFVVAVLIALPQIPIKLKTRVFSLDTKLGGYYISLFDGKKVYDYRAYKKGLDIKGGIKITLKADMSKLPASEYASALESAREVIERRVNYLGVSEPYIVTSRFGDEFRIIVEIPGVNDVAAAAKLIGQTAQLTFKQLKKDYDWTEAKYLEYFLNPEAWEYTGIAGADLKGAVVEVATQPQLSASGGRSPQVKLIFTPEGLEKFSTLAKANVGRPIGIFLDEAASPISMPVISPDLADGVLSDPVISGNFDLESAKSLSIQIRAGALPVPVEIIGQDYVKAALGEESVKKSYQAAGIGAIVILLYMLILYKKLGLIADCALILYACILLALFKIIPVTITVPGVAGFLLSIGVAVDANVLIFERIREELRLGLPKSLAVKHGFERAWPSIRDSNISSLLTASILFYIGSGPVRGFALTLALGILVSLFTAVFVVRTLIYAFRLES